MEGHPAYKGLNSYAMRLQHNALDSSRDIACLLAGEAAVAAFGSHTFQQVQGMYLPVILLQDSELYALAHSKDFVGNSGSGGIMSVEVR